MENDQITLDVEIMKRMMKALLVLEDEISATMNYALGILFKQIYNELTSGRKQELENDAHFLNIFLIIFQLPVLSDPIFIYETAYSFYSLFTKISIDLQAKFVRVLAKYPNDLKSYVAHVQQYITMRTVRWCDHKSMSDVNEALVSTEHGK